MPITEAILCTAAAHPDRIAIAAGADRIGYAQLVESSRRTIAAVDALHAQGRTAPAPEADGIPITAVSVDSAFHAARIMASLAGYRAIAAVIDPRWPLAHRVAVIVRTGIGAVVSDDPALADALTAGGWSGTIITLDAFLRLESEAMPAPAPTVRDGAEAFLLLFSSGTTADPKAFLKTRAQYRANVAISAAHLEPGPGVVTLAPGPLSYSLTLYAVIECLATGGSVHLADRFDAAGLGRRIRDEAVTRVVAVPAVVQSLTDAARRDPDAVAGLELVVTGGANLPAALREAFATALPHARLISYYGAAEIGFIGDSRDADGTRISVYDGVQVAVRDAHGADAPPGELGTLWVRADACSDGYISATTDAALRGPDGWASVGDQASLADGTLTLAGRAGDIAVTGGHKVSLVQVEQTFAGMPGGCAVCAVALPHPRLGSVVALVLEAPAAQDVPDRAELVAWARAHLAPQFVPRRWYRVDALARTVGGKIRRQRVAEAVGSGGAVRL